MKISSFGGLGFFLVAFVFRRPVNAMPTQWFINRNTARRLQYPSKRCAPPPPPTVNIVQQQQVEDEEEPEEYDTNYQGPGGGNAPPNPLNVMLNANYNASGIGNSLTGNNPLSPRGVMIQNQLNKDCGDISYVINSWFESIDNPSVFNYVKYRGGRELYLPLGDAIEGINQSGRADPRDRYKNYDMYWEAVRIMFDKIFDYIMVPLVAAHDINTGIGFRYLTPRTFSNTGPAIAVAIFPVVVPLIGSSCPREMFVPAIDVGGGGADAIDRVRCQNNLLAVWNQ